MEYSSEEDFELLRLKEAVAANPTDVNRSNLAYHCNSKTIGDLGKAVLNAFATKTNLLVCTVGYPRSGKSTWAMHQSSGAIVQAAIINPDSIRLAICGQEFYAPAEPLVWAHVDVAVRAAFAYKYRIVLLDSTNLQENYRAVWRTRREWNTLWVRFNTPKDVCYQRAVAEGNMRLAEYIAGCTMDPLLKSDKVITAYYEGQSGHWAK
jgi:predicted kinase